MEIRNRKAGFDYEIVESFEAGVNLLGAEVKSLRGGRATLDGSYVRAMGSEVYLIGAQISPYPFARPEGYDPKRTRKLLLHKREILKLKHRTEADGLTLVPLSWYTKGPRIKLCVALARGKKQFEKRDKIKKREDKRSLERMFRGKVK
jgi:SsrA-binding protein